MPYAVILLFALATMLVTSERNNLRLVTPSAAQQQTSIEGSSFIAYRNAVLTFVQSNPTFVGAVPTTSLPVQPSASILVDVGNYVSAAGGKSREITAYARLSSGALYSAMASAGGDASLGTSTGTGWVSAAPDANKAEMPLNVSVPAGYAVSVMQIGSKS